jgi:predicted permease
MTMSAFFSDVRHSFRTLRKSPLFTFVAIASLALGLGANTAIFSMLDQALLRPLPVKYPSELVLFTSPGPNRGTFNGDNSERLFSHPLYADLRDRNQVFSGLIARAPGSANFVYQKQSEAVTAELVSGNFFDVLGVNPLHGRLLSAHDDLIKNAHPVVVLGYAFWMRRFGGDPKIVNQTVRINDSLMTVTGIAPRGFFGVDVGRVPDLFVPLAMKTTVTPTSDGYDERTYHFLHVIGRLKPGVSAAQAKASLQVIYKPMLDADLAVMTGNVSERFRTRFLAKQLLIEPAYNGVPTFRENAQTPLYVLMAMVGLVLLIACANVANLLVARSIGRQKEIAIRLAMGASRKDVVRQLIAESLVLSILGALAGLLVAIWTAGVLVQAIPSYGGTSGLNATLDPRSVVFAFALALLTGIGFGLLPAIQSTRPDVYPVLKNQAAGVVGSFGQIRSRQALVVAQVALSLLLLVGAGLFTRSLVHLRSLDPGFRTGNMVLFSVDASRNGYNQTRVHQLYEDIQKRLAAVPAVSSASLAVMIPLSGDSSQNTIKVEGYEPKTDEDMSPHFDEISPGYFATMGIPLLAGRDFTERDKLGATKVAVVNETFAKRYFGSANPLGRHFGYRTESATETEIVGVVKDGKFLTLRDKNLSFVFVPYQQDKDLGNISATIRTLAPPESLMPALRREIASVDSNLAIWDLKTMETQVNESLFAERLTAILCACFGALATILASIGLYGVTAFSVARRTREIGIRMALGAGRGRGRVLGMVLREVSWLCLIGIGLGVPLAIALSRYIVSQLYGVAPTDVPTLVVASLIMLSVSLIAGFLPARRAATVDPTIALRYE